MVRNILGFGEKLRGIFLLCILSPLLVAYSSYHPMWDELYFLHHAVCVARTVWSASLSQLDVCMSAIAKSPLMAILLIPGGPIRGNLEELGLAPFVLGLATAGAVLLLAKLTARALMPLPAVLIAAISAIAAPPLWNNGVPFLVDGFLAVIVACTVTLLFVELEAPTVSLPQTIGRAALWAFVLTLGLLSKTTYAAIVLLLAPAALIASWKRSGPRSTMIKLGFLAVFLVPAGFVLARYGKLYFAHASDSAFGPLSAFYDDGLSRLAFLTQTLREIWPLIGGLLTLGVWASIVPAERGRVGIALWAVAVLLAYFVLAAGSPNKDPRFFWLVWLALPFCVAGLVARMPATPAPSAIGRGLGVVLAIALALPIFGRMRLDGVAEAIQTMALLPTNKPVSVIIATDEPYFNIETMILAKQLNWNTRSQMEVSQVVYDIVMNHTPTASLERLAKADYVIGRFPVPPGAPEWTNRFAPIFEQALRASGRRVELVPTSPPITIFTPERAEAK